MGICSNIEGPVCGTGVIYFSHPVCIIFLPALNESLKVVLVYFYTIPDKAQERVCCVVCYFILLGEVIISFPITCNNQHPLKSRANQLAPTSNKCI